jgi:hypothetical protein
MESLHNNAGEGHRLLDVQFIFMCNESLVMRDSTSATSIVRDKAMAHMSSRRHRRDVATRAQSA